MSSNTGEQSTLAMSDQPCISRREWEPSSSGSTERNYQLCISGSVWKPPHSADDTRPLDITGSRNADNDLHSSRPRGDPKLQQLMKLSSSVGHVVTPYCEEVGFRVGDDLIMTAYHILFRTIDQTGTDVSLYKNKDTCIIFDRGLKFQFLQAIYVDTDLDTVLLQLYNPENRDHPDPLTLSYRDLSFSEVAFIAFNKSGLKEVYVSRTDFSDLKKEVREFSMQLNDNGFCGNWYKDLDNERILAVKTPLRHGASGAPAIVETVDGEKVVVALLLKGYPECYYDSSPEDQKKIPSGFLCEGAVKLKAVRSSMINHTEQRVRDIGKYIFSSNVREQSISMDTDETSGSTERNYQLCISGSVWKPPHSADDTRPLDITGSRNADNDLHSSRPRGDPKLEQLIKLSSSVGRVVTPYCEGVGFRVGDNLIMTTYHILYRTIDQTGTDVSLYKNKDTCIIFDRGLKFQFLQAIYVDTDLDTVLLQLYNPENRDLPDPLTLSYRDLSFSEVAFIAFNNSGSKEVYVSRTDFSDLKKEAKEFSMHLNDSGFCGDWYKDLDNERILAVKTPLRHGASGAPAIVETVDGEKVVVAMLLKGYPECYYDSSPEDQKKKKKIPSGHMCTKRS